MGIGNWELGVFFYNELPSDRKRREAHSLRDRRDSCPPLGCLFFVF
ncbi:MAG: hypothetical protein F6K47_14645 [Symploca sp. SIO2E6]|nr:hypothetical protein [Symploca sp. SIO2E6]